MPHEGDTDEDAELIRIRNTVLEWRAEAARKGKPLRLPVMPFLLRNVWTGAMLLFAILMFSTFFIETVFTVSSRLLINKDFVITNDAPLL
jgi:solute carrier family 45, member 1/2/4